MTKTVFLLFFLSTIYTPGNCQYIEITDRTMDIDKLGDLVNSSNADFLQFRNCSFKRISGFNSESGVDIGGFTLAPSAKVRGISFMSCSFNGTGFGVEKANVDVHIENSHNILYIDIKDSPIYIGENTSISALRGSGRVRMEIDQSTIETIELSSILIEMLAIKASVVESIKLDSIKVKFPVHLSVDDDGILSWNTLADSLRYLPRENGNLIRYNFSLLSWAKKVFSGYSYNGIKLEKNKIGFFSITNSSLPKGEQAVFPIYNCEIDFFTIANSTLGLLDLYGSTINKLFKFQKSTLEGLNLMNTSITTTNIPGLDFHKFRSKIYVFSPDDLSLYERPYVKDSIIYLYDTWTEEKHTISFSTLEPFKASNAAELMNTELFPELINNYSKLYVLYKAREDIHSANLCYAEMKDLYTRQLREIFAKEPSFNNFFRWQLSVIVKIYTRHGTDPALALTISFWTIVLFAFFYFFFPSDWDITSKSKMFNDFNVFRRKNDQGYVKPFFKLLGVILVSFLNAFTLSLNAYTTLGFGNIPTHGVARYACVFQGFIGWFMLSIFTVALINQVLF